MNTGKNCYKQTDQNITKLFFNRLVFIVLICFSLQSFTKKHNKIKNQGINSESKESKEIKKSHISKKPITQKASKILWIENKGPQPFKVEIIAEGLGVPWGMLFLDKENLLLTEREGFIKKIHIPTGKIIQITGAPVVYAKGQGGLLDVILHPEFKKTQWIYLTYSIEKRGNQSTALARGVLKGNKIIRLKVLFTAKPFQSSSIHFGSRLTFDDEGFLFMTVGDRGKKKEAQNLGSHLGKLLRLNDKGKAVSDSPFIKIKGAKQEIWSFGHRNPQGLFIHPETKQLWLQEHGPKGGDEINLIKKGGNYGWPVITYGKSYIGFKIGEGTHKKEMEQPVKYFTPSIAPCGLLIYSGKRFPKWKGDFFSGALILTHLNKLKIHDETVLNEEKLLSSFGFRFRNVIEGPEGFIYAAVDQGMILKISPL